MILFARALVGALILLCSSCAVIRTAAAAAGGGLIGFAVAGAPGAAAGAGFAAGGSEFFNEKERADKDRDAARAELRLVNDQIVELRATIKANEQIAEHNLHLPAGKRAVAFVEPNLAPDDGSSPWYTRAWHVLLGVLVLAIVGWLLWRFHRPIKHALRQIPDLVRGRRPGATPPK